MLLQESNSPNHDEDDAVARAKGKRLVLVVFIIFSLTFIGLSAYQVMAVLFGGARVSVP